MPTVQVSSQKFLHSLKTAQTEARRPQFRLPERLKRLALFQVSIKIEDLFFDTSHANKTLNFSTAPTPAINGVTRYGHAFSSIPNWTTSQE